MTRAGLLLSTFALAACGAGSVTQPVESGRRGQPVDSPRSATGAPSTHATATSTSAPLPTGTSAAAVAPSSPAEPAAISDAELTAKTSRGDGDTARLGLGGDVELVVAVRTMTSSETGARLAIALVQGDKVLSRRDDFRAAIGLDPKTLPGFAACEAWQAAARRETFGSVEGVRVSLACRNGEDFFSATELAVLYRVGATTPRDLGALERVWAGVANAEQNEMGSCLSNRDVTFRIVDRHTLEKTIAERTRWVEQLLDAEAKRKLRASCRVGTRKRVERVSLP